MLEKRIFTVSAENVGQRVDKFLSNEIPEFSRSEVQRFNVVKLIGDGRNTVKGADKVKLGDTFEVEIPDQPTDESDLIPVAPSDIDLDIVYEDDDILVVNKPRGVVMYPAAGNSTGTFVQQILSYTKLSSLGGTTRPGVVHRLDKDTSGVMVLAKSDAAYRGLVKVFSEHNLTRKYVAFVWGIPNWESADITGNISRSSRNRQKMTMVKKGGKEAQTEVNVMNIWPREKISAFRCTLFTGRTHQIRVHLSAHGFPVLCDPIYGRGSTRLGSVKNPDLFNFLKEHSGQMLHAEVLEFLHPVTGAQMHFKTRLPDDMQELKEILDSSAEN